MEHHEIIVIDVSVSARRYNNTRTGKEGSVIAQANAESLLDLTIDEIADKVNQVTYEALRNVEGQLRRRSSLDTPKSSSSPADSESAEEER